MKKNTSNEMYSFLSLSISNFFIVIIRYVYTNCHGIGTKWIRFFVIVCRLLRISQRCDKIFQICANRRYHNVKSKFSHVVPLNDLSKNLLTVYDLFNFFDNILNDYRMIMRSDD